MAKVVRIKGSPDTWLAQSPDGWVNEKGDLVPYRAQPDNRREEYDGEEGDRKVELLGGFGGKVNPKPKPTKMTTKPILDKPVSE